MSNNLDFINDPSGLHKERSFVGVFGETSTESFQTDVSVIFSYGINTNYDVTNGSTGTGSLSFANSKLQINSGTSGVGIATSIDRSRYRAGHSSVCRFTLKAEVAPTSVELKVRNNSVDTLVNPLSINGIDFTKLNIFQISWGYLGDAPILVDIMEPGGTNFRPLIEYLPTGMITTTHISNPYLPMRVEVSNTYIRAGLFESDSGIFIEYTLPSGSHTAECGSWMSGVLTSSPNPSNRPIHFDLQTGQLAATTGSKYQNIATFRSKSTFNSLPNKILSVLFSFDYLVYNTSANGVARIALIKNGTPDSAFAGWTDVAPGDSVIEYSTTNTLITNTYVNRGFSQSAWCTTNIGANPGRFSPGTIEAEQLKLVLQPDGVTTYSIGVQFTAGTFYTDISLNWLDMF